MVPAQAILEQFERAKVECQDPAKMGAWLPMLSQYGPDLLVLCQNASDMSRQLVREWLGTYMFRNDPDRRAKARRIANWLANHRYFKSHGRHVPRGAAEKRGLKIEHLEANQQFQDLVLSVFHATTHTFNATTAVKIIENHKGRAFIKQVQPVFVQMPPPQGLIVQPAPTQAPAEEPQEQ
jgi:hypothetical protein